MDRAETSPEHNKLRGAKQEEEMDKKQMRAVRNIRHAINWHIGGLENTMIDSMEDSEDYITAEAQLANHDGLVKDIYWMATNEYYKAGGMMYGEQAKKMVREIRFCGKDWLMSKIDEMVRKEGY